MSNATRDSMDLVVISDLHLSTGRPDPDGKYSCNEDFFFDEEFRRFLQHLQNEKPGKTHLVIAGDLFDFLQVCSPELLGKGGAPSRITKAERKYGLGTEEEKAKWKLGVIADGHQVFFQAVAEFVSTGNRLSILAGNHDIELYWPKVRDALVERVYKFCSKSDQDAIEKEKRIRFYPWCYYDPEYKTYIEHGNQYDPLNSFPHLLHPVLARDPKLLWLPFGSFFVRYFFNKLETGHPFADNIKPATEYMQWAWRNDRGLFVDHIFRYLPLMLWLFLRGLRRSRRSDLETENRNRIDELSATLGLQEKRARPSGPQDQRSRPSGPQSDDSSALQRIYALKAKPHGSLWFLNPFAYSTFFYIIVFAVIFVVLFFGYDLRALKSLGSSLVALVIPLIRWLPQTGTVKSVGRWTLTQLPSFMQRSGGPIAKWVKKRFGRDRLTESLKDIRDCFVKANVDLHAIITGHTHDPDVKSVDETCTYFNTGTWTTVFSEEERLVRRPVQFTFVWVSLVDGKPKARLRQWNDNRQEIQPVILLGDSR